MIKLSQFVSVFVPSMIFVVTVPIIFLATKPFVSLQYSLLPNNVDQRSAAQVSLAILTSFQKSTQAQNHFASIKQSGQILPLYTPLEVNHLVDVKTRFDVVRLAAFVSLVVLAFQACIFKPVEFIRQLYKSSVLGLFIVMISGVLSITSWNWFFVTFHELIFPAGNWRFSETSGLIQLFPEVFWFRFGLAWIGTILLIIVALTLISKRIIKRSSPN